MRDERRASKRRILMGAPHVNRSSASLYPIAPSGRPLVDAGRALPVEHVDQLPRVLVQLDLKLALLVDRKLGQGKQHAGALFLVLVVKVKLTRCQVEGC